MKVVWLNIKVLRVIYFIQFEDRDEDYVALNWNKQWSKSFFSNVFNFYLILKSNKNKGCTTKY